MTTTPGETDLDPNANAAVLEPDDGSSDDQAQRADDGDAEPELEEAELPNGLKVFVPKGKAEDIKKGFLLEKDYTQSKQKLADEKREYEARSAALVEQEKANREFLADVAGIETLRGDIKKYEEFTDAQWRQLYQQDQLAYHEHQRNWQRLKDQATAKIGDLRQKDAARRDQTQREHAKRLDDGRATVAKKIPGYNDEAERNLKTFAGSLGFSEQEFSDAFADPRLIELVHWARVGKEAANKSAASLPKVPGDKPLTPIGRRSTPSAGLSDGLSAEEWTRRRDEQVKQRKAAGRR